MQLLNQFHQRAVHSRRVNALSNALLPLLPTVGTVLDIGSGDGWLASLLAAQLPGTRFSGIDVLIREQTHVPVAHFDGQHIPYPDQHFDAVMIIDVLHHTHDPAVLLREARRVARKHVILKDHTRDGLAARATLRMMDWVGNAHHGVALPYNYLSMAEWLLLFEEVGLTVEQLNEKPKLYGAPADWLFGRSLHLVAQLSPHAI
jgi:SAM-dependent methyltransferase